MLRRQTISAYGARSSNTAAMEANMRQLTLIVLLLTAVSAGAQAPSSKKDAQEPAEVRELGIAPAHYAAPPPADPDQRRIREIRGARWNNPGYPELKIPTDPQGRSVMFVHRIRVAPEFLPVAESDAIVVGNVQGT